MFSPSWLRLRNAEQEYFSALYEFTHRNAAADSDLKQALAKAGDMVTALRLLLEIELATSLVALLLPELMDIALDSGSLTAIPLARDVLYRVRKEPEIRSAIPLVAATYLNVPDEWPYRRLAELYQQLNYRAELATLLARCRASDEAEIRELAADFEGEQE